MSQRLFKIWLDKSMQDDWNLRVLRRVHKMGDSAVCANYSVMSFLNMAYEVLSRVSCERLRRH